jgi:hypothetical protein
MSIDGTSGLNHIPESSSPLDGSASLDATKPKTINIHDGKTTEGVPASDNDRVLVLDIKNMGLDAERIPKCHVHFDKGTPPKAIGIVTMMRVKLPQSGDSYFVPIFTGKTTQEFDKLDDKQQAEWSNHFSENFESQLGQQLNTISATIESLDNEFDKSGGWFSSKMTDQDVKDLLSPGSFLTSISHDNYIKPGGYIDSFATKAVNTLNFFRGKPQVQSLVPDQRLQISHDSNKRSRNIIERFLPSGTMHRFKSGHTGNQMLLAQKMDGRNPRNQYDSGKEKYTFTPEGLQQVQNNILDDMESDNAMQEGTGEGQLKAFLDTVKDFNSDAINQSDENIEAEYQADIKNITIDNPGISRKEGQKLENEAEGRFQAKHFIKHAKSTSIEELEDDLKVELKEIENNSNLSPPEKKQETHKAKKNFKLKKAVNQKHQLSNAHAVHNNELAKIEATTYTATRTYTGAVKSPEQVKHAAKVKENKQFQETLLAVHNTYCGVMGLQQETCHVSNRDHLNFLTTMIARQVANGPNGAPHIRATEIDGPSGSSIDGEAENLLNPTETSLNLDEEEEI